MAFPRNAVQGAFAFKAWNGAFESHIGVEVGALIERARYRLVSPSGTAGRALEAHQHCVPSLAGLGLHGNSDCD